MARSAVEAAGYGPRAFDVRVKEAKREGELLTLRGTFQDEISGPKHTYEVVYDRDHQLLRTKID